MDPTERVIAVIDGNELDRIQTFCADLEEWPVQQILGMPFVSPKTIFLNPFSRFFLDRWGKRLKSVFVDPFIDNGMMKHIEAAVQLGFDSTWSSYEWRLMLWDSRTLARVTGYFSDLIDDGHGNLSYMYRGPAITSSRALDEWPYFPDPDEIAQKCFTFFKKALSQYKDQICIMGNSCTGLHEAVTQSIGFENAVLAIRREPAFIRRFIEINEHYLMKTYMAMMDAGLRVILHADDFSQKTGPMMSPRVLDELFGGPYERLTKAVHDRGGKILLHSCGDNTKLFDLFIKWGFDGGHTFENTSNVSITHIKKTYGDRFAIIGGVGIDYILTSRSKAEEVVETVKTLMKTCARGGRFIIGPVHAHTDVAVDKLRLMIETVKEHGRYPLSL